MKVKILLLGIFIAYACAYLVAQKNITVDMNACTCQKNEPIKYNYLPRFNRLTDYKMFSKLIDWKLAGGEETFNGFAYKNLQTLNSSWNLTLVSFKSPTMFIHPEDSISINITPCSKNVEFEIGSVISRPISKYIPNFDWENEIEPTAKNYVNILLKITKPKSVLFSIFMYSSTGGIESFIDTINQKYNTNIKLEYKELETGQFFDPLLVALDKNNVPFEDFLLNTFILTDTIPHILNIIEESKINLFFNTNVRNLFTQSIGLWSNSEFIGLIIDANMLRKWDDIENKALTDSLGNYSSTEILVNISKFRFETQKGINLQIKNICLPKSEIGGTGIVIDYSGENVELLNSSRLVIHSGVNISIPKEKINIQAENVNINNKVIFGDIMFSEKKNINKTIHYFEEKGLKVRFKKKIDKMHFEYRL